MPWNQSGPMDERLRFVAACEAGLWPMSELCRRFGVSRRTGYKILDRYRDEGVDGLKDRSRAPLSSPQRIAPPVESVLLEARRAHPHWGPRKIRAWLIGRQPEFANLLPAASTVGDLYRRHGLSRPRKRRVRREDHVPAGTLTTSMPNEVWTADFKGEFRLGNRHYCYPFTLVDAHSRYLLGCRAEPSTSLQGARSGFLEAFRAFGLPAAIRTDNGTPFVGHGRTSLTRLSVWWIKLGIRHQRIPKSRPDQNGRHERMHRTLKAEATRPPAATFEAQQVRFDAFCREFNHERPHEALAQQPPASCYRPSERPYPNRLPGPQYEGYFETRKVDGAGVFKFQGSRVFIGEPLAGEMLGLVETDDAVWSLRFYEQELGRISTRKRKPMLKVLPVSPV